jgi:hypothetical protein
MNPTHITHERVTEGMSQEQELPHQEAFEPSRVAIYPSGIAGRITHSSQASITLIGVRPDLRSDKWTSPTFRADEMVPPSADCPMADTEAAGKG